MGPAPEVGASDDRFQSPIDVELAEAARRRRRRRVLTATTCLAVAGALMVVGTLIAGSGTKPSPAASDADQARNAVTAALHRASTDRTADIQMHMTIQGGGQLFTIIGSGAMDIGSQSAEFAMSATDGSQTIELKMVYIGGEAYEAIPQLPQLVPGKQWVSLDPADLSQSGLQNPSALGVGGDPVALLSLLQLQNSSVAELGKGGNAGADGTGYLVTVAPDDIRSMASRGSLPQPLQLLASAPLSSLSAQVYVDRTGRLTGDTIVVGLTTPDPVTVTDDVQFSAYGTPIKINPPPASVVITYGQLIHDIGNGQQLVL